MSKPKVANRYLFLAFVIGAILSLCGCESNHDPEVTGLASRDYEETFSVDVSMNKVYVLVGSTEYQGVDHPANVTIDPEPVSGESLQFRIRVVGLSLDTNPRAIMGYRWSGDTLRVWCGYDAPAAWEDKVKTSAADPWQPPYFIPREVNIGSPATVEVQYLGQWFE